MKPADRIILAVGESMQVLRGHRGYPKIDQLVKTWDEFAGSGFLVGHLEKFKNTGNEMDIGEPFTEPPENVHNYLNELEFEAADWSHVYSNHGL